MRRARSRTRPLDPDPAAVNGWDRPYPSFDPPEIPTHVGAVSWCKRPVVEDVAELHRRAPDVAIVGAPLGDAMRHRTGARFGPRAIRQATYTQGAVADRDCVQVGLRGARRSWPGWMSSRCRPRTVTPR